VSIKDAKIEISAPLFSQQDHAWIYSFALSHSMLGGGPATVAVGVQETCPEADRENAAWNVLTAALADMHQVAKGRS